MAPMKPQPPRTQALLWLLSVTLAFAAGWMGGRKSPPAARAAISLPAKPETARTAQAAPRETSVKRWAEKLRDADRSQLPLLFAEIPAKDRGQAIEAWLLSHGAGGPDAQAEERLRNLLDAWVAADADGAWQWAEGCRDAGIREMAMTGIAGALAAGDPQRAYQCLLAHGEFRRELNDSRLSGMMKRLSKDTLKQSPEALAELWEKLPETTASTRWGLDLELDASADFRAVLDGLRSKLEGVNKRPFYPCNVMDTWMRHDAEGAVAYLRECISAKGSFASVWSEASHVIRQEKGQPGADAWALALLRDLPEQDRGVFLAETAWLGSPGRVEAVVRQGGTEEELAGWTGMAIQACADRDRHGWKIGSMLENFPMEKRIELLKGLRGPEALGAAGQAVSHWQLPESRWAEIRSAITGQ